MNAHRITRRQMLGVGCAATVAATLPRRAGAAPDYSFTQGEFEITVLSDGFISIPGEIVAPDMAPAERSTVLSRLDTEGGLVRAQCNIPLIRKGDDVILVDIGSGRKYQPSDGNLTRNLQGAGYDPAVVTKVVFTHGHPDHIWGTLAEDGGLRFPNAAYFVGAAEWDFWTDPNYLTTMPAALHEFARGAQRDLGAVKDRVVMLKPGDDIVTGLRALDTAGHTPGHLSLEMAGGEGLLIAADVATNQIVSLEHPEWTFGYDTLPDLAIRNRLRMLDRAATDRTKLLGYHWAYPGVGYAERRSGAFRFAATA